MLPTHPEIIAKWPSIREFGEDIGAEYNTAKHIRRRGLIPVRYWPQIVDAAQRRGFRNVTLHALTAGAASSQKLGGSTGSAPQVAA
jgi:hypothetical protein